MLNNDDVVHITDKGQHRIEEVIHAGRTLREPEVDILMYLHQPGEATVEELGMLIKLQWSELIPAIEWLRGLDYVYVIPFRIKLGNKVKEIPLREEDRKCNYE